MFRRPIFEKLLPRFRGPRQFLQVLAGPRQTGKTTLAHQILSTLDMPSHYATADAPVPREAAWLEEQWEVGRQLARNGAALLVVDEVQKILGWSETVKKLWDQDTWGHVPLHVLVLGSSPLLVRKGLTESLAGRFELTYITHWSYAEMRAAFGFDLDQYLYFGGYPGAVSLVEDEERWAAYVRDSLIETTVSRDILLLNRVDKPALLRRLFELGCRYSGQILSYQKMLGQLQDAGNTTTLAHYLELLAGAGLIVGLQKYSGRAVRARASSPKLLALNTGLVSALSDLSFQSARGNTEFWGRLVETAVGAHLFNGCLGQRMSAWYWREKNSEVDFVLQRGAQLVAIEVKSGRRRDSLPGVSLFKRRFGPDRVLLVGGDGIPLEDFLTTSVADLFPASA